MNTMSLKNLLIAVAVAYALIFLLLIFANIALYRSPDPVSYTPVVACAAFYAGAFICGFIASKLHGENGTVYGLIAGIIYIGVIFIVSLFFKGERNFITRLLLNCAALLTALGGGFAGAFRRKVRISPEKSRENARRKYARGR